MWAGGAFFAGGREITVGVFHENGEQPVALPVIESSSPKASGTTTRTAPVALLSNTREDRLWEGKAVLVIDHGMGALASLHEAVPEDLPRLRRGAP